MSAPPTAPPSSTARIQLPLQFATPLSALAGLALWLAFPPVGFAPGAVAGVALLTAALWRASPARGFLLGLLSGGVFFALLLDWMRVVGTDAWILLTILCAAWIGLLGMGTTLVTRLPAAPVWVACVWVLDEALRARIPWGGFPWGNLSFALPDSPLGSWAALGGLPVATFAVALVGACLVTVVHDLRARRRRPAAGWGVVAVATSLVPLLIPVPVAGDDVGGAPTTVVAVVQGGTPQTGMGAMDVRRAVLDNHVSQTLLLADAIEANEAAQPAFVLWPENSTDIDPFTDPTVAADITKAAQAVGVPILVGAVTSVPGEPTGAWNVGIVWDPESGPTQMYVKTHPVPFGEYIPFRDFLAEHIGRFDRVPRDFLAGTEPGNLAIGGVAVGNVICFEIAYAEVVGAVVDGGARLITVQTNNATYGGTPQPEQQLGISRMRAIEAGRAVLVAATSGISAVILPDGSAQELMGEDETGWLVAEVPLRGTLTLASRIATAVEVLLCLIALAAIVAGAAQPRIRRRRGIT